MCTPFHTGAPTCPKTSCLYPEANLLSSLDCRHVFCGPCLVTWFTSQGSTTCPGCRVESRGQPQRDYALCDVLSMVYESQGRNAPSVLSENFDPSAFTTIYVAREERARERRERIRHVVDIATAQLQLPRVPINDLPGGVIDVDMMDGEGSDWDLGSGVDSDDAERVLADDEEEL